MQRFNALFVALVLTGCSSPPEPPAVDWKQPGDAINTAIPAWSETTTVVHSPNVSGHWLQTINFVDDSQLWPPRVWYAIAHSTSITIESTGSASYFRAKSWLQNHGANAVIYFSPLKDSITQQTRITLSR